MTISFHSVPTKRMNLTNFFQFLIHPILNFSCLISPIAGKASFNLFPLTIPKSRMTAKHHRRISKFLCRCSINDAPTISSAAEASINGNSSSDQVWIAETVICSEVEQAERCVSLLKVYIFKVYISLLTLLMYPLFVYLFMHLLAFWEMAVCSSVNVVIPSSFRGLHVLLVDHDIKSLTQIASLLEQQSYRVTATERASAALSMIQEGGQYELILADVNMLEMDIFKFIKEISQYNLPIVVMASREDMIKAEKVIRECKVSLLGKPFQAKSILNVWQHVHRMRRIPIKETTVASSTVADNLSEQTSNGNANGILKPIEKEKGQKMKNKRHLSSRMIWTPDLHSRFVEALNALGEQKAHPKALLRKMDVPFLTHRHIASHLQKHRARIRRQSKNSMCDQSFMTKSVINSSNAYGSHPTTFVPKAPTTRPGLNACGATYLTLETLKDQLKIRAETSTRNTTLQTFNRDEVWGPKIGNEKLAVALGTNTENVVPGMIPSELNYPSNLQNLLNSSTPNSDVIPGCLENFNHLSLPISGQMEETKYLRDIEEGASNQIEAMSGVATSSLNEEQGSSLGVHINMIAQLLENEDLENFGDIGGDDVDRYSQWLSAPSNN